MNSIDIDFEAKYKRLGDRWDKLHSRSKWGLVASVFFGGLAIGFSISMSHWFLLLFIPCAIAQFFSLWCFNRIAHIQYQRSSLLISHYGKGELLKGE